MPIEQWRDVVRKSNGLKSIRSSIRSQHCCSIISSNAITAIVIFPLCCIFLYVMICSFNHGVDALQICFHVWIIYAYTFLFYLICLSSAGVYYSLKLHKMIFALKSFKMTTNRNMSQKKRH